jgi:hypothetical protein
MKSGNVPSKDCFHESRSIAFPKNEKKKNHKSNFHFLQTLFDGWGFVEYRPFWAA